MSDPGEVNRITETLYIRYGIRTRQMLSKLFTISKWLFTPVALIFLLMAIWHSRIIIRDTLEHCLLLYLELAVLTWSVAHLLSPLFVSTVMNACGGKVGYHQVLDLHLRYLPARYIPGGIWHTVARVGGLHNLGTHPRHLSSFVILENLVALGVTLSAGGILVGLLQGESVWQPLAYLASAISMIILVLCPLLVNRLILRTAGSISYMDYIKAVILSVIFWSFATTSFLFYVFALSISFDLTVWLEIAGAYLFSWGLGFIAIFAPQGVGVFEVVAAKTMPMTNMPFSALVALLAGFRLVVLLADVLVWMGWIVQTNLKKYFFKNLAP